MSFFRVVKMVFDRFVNNPSFARVVKLLYIPPVRGGMYITILTALARLASSVSSDQQFDRLLEGVRLNARQLSADRFAQDVLRRGAQAVGRGVLSATHNEFLPTNGLGYISRAWLVIMPSVRLGFRAASAPSPVPCLQTVTGEVRRVS